METSQYIRPVLNEEISLTEKAAEQVRKIKAENNIPEAHGLRLSVKGGGSVGVSYVLGFDEAPRENDRVLECFGIRIFVDQKSAFFISGTVLDFSDGLQGKGFVFQSARAMKAGGARGSLGMSRTGGAE
jgi:iron-sulfur cluster assembly protein